MSQRTKKVVARDFRYPHFYQLPQTVIDLLLSVSACDNDPDMIEKVIPTLCKAIKIRDQFGNASNQDVIGFLDW